MIAVPGIGPGGSSTAACGKSTSTTSGRLASAAAITALPAAERSVATGTGKAPPSASTLPGRPMRGSGQLRNSSQMPAISAPWRAASAGAGEARVTVKAPPFIWRRILAVRILPP